MIFLKIFVIAFFLNLLWELLHSVLYTTCIEMPVKKYAPLMLKASLVDGLWITIMYAVSTLVFSSENPLTNSYQLIFFTIISIGWAYFWEVYSIKNKRWEYAKAMPTLLGAGVTPLIQLFCTGLLVFVILF